MIPHQFRSSSRKVAQKLWKLTVWRRKIATGLTRIQNTRVDGVCSQPLPASPPICFTAHLLRFDLSHHRGYTCSSFVVLYVPQASLLPLPLPPPLPLLPCLPKKLSVCSVSALSLHVPHVAPTTISVISPMTSAW